jgi:hypothetical protein
MRTNEPTTKLSRSLRLFRETPFALTMIASALLVSSCAPNIQRVKPAVDPSLLVKCPDFVVWGVDEDIAEYLLKVEKRYADCQARQGTLADRIIDMMDH